MTVSRATFPDLEKAETSEPDEHIPATLVREGATIGAGCTIGNDLVIGRFAMVEMGPSSRNRCRISTGPRAPSRSIGCVCRCGQPTLRFPGMDRRSTRRFPAKRAA
jgi:UDP-3-O-[3-hydroxymyristoyl] glucosamine N-acyltransferase